MEDNIIFYFCNRITEDKEEKRLKDIIYNHVHSFNGSHKVHLDILILKEIP